MKETYGPNVYTNMGLRPFINCAGNGTKLGGSHYSAEVLQAVDDANEGYVYMADLLEKSGEYVADLLGTEAAYVASGAFAALALSAAGCMAGRERENIDRLPDTAGLKNEIVLQKSQRFNYDRAFTVVGATIVEAGDGDGCTGEELTAAIGPDTAAVAYRVSSAGSRDNAAVPLEEAVRVAHEREVPVIADAVKEIYPADYFRGVAQSADLVCFSGKYFGGPTSAGFVCGDRELIETVALHGHMGFYGAGRSFGRGFKVGRQEVVGLVAALEAWLTMDHEERLLGIDAKLEALQRRLETVPTISRMELTDGRTYAGSSLHIVLDTEALGKSVPDISAELDSGDPRILMGASGDDTLIVMVRNLRESEDEMVAQRLTEVLSG